MPAHLRVPVSLPVVFLCSLALGLAACHTPAPVPEPQELDTRIDEVSATRDRLLHEVAQNARLMSEISKELVRAQALASNDEERAPLEVTKQRILGHIEGLTRRLLVTEAHLRDGEKEIRKLGAETTVLRRTLANLRATVASQMESLAGLTGRVNALKQANVQLAVQNTVLTDKTAALRQTMATLREKQNTVYYIVGKKEDLLREGIIDEKGGGRPLLVFGKRGQVLVPSPDLNRSDFRAIDKRKVREIPLPQPMQLYYVASNQDLSALGSKLDDQGLATGNFWIADPNRFWASDRYLILVMM